MATALHSPVENSIIELINDRIDTWRAIVNAQVSYFANFAELERQANVIYGKMAAALAAALPAENPTLGSASASASTPTAASASSCPPRTHAWLGPLQSHALRSSFDGETFSRYIRESVLPQLESLREELKRRARDIKRRLGETEVRLAKRHEELVAAMETHERGWSQRIRLGVCDAATEEETLSESLATADVFISEQHLRHRISLFLGEKRTYCASVMDLYAETRLLEHDMATALKNTLREMMLVKGKQMTASAELLADCAEMTGSVEPLIEWHAAVKKCRLDWDWSVAAPPTDGFTASVLTQIGCSLSGSLNGSAAELDAPIRPISVAKCGFLIRPSTFGRSWTVLFCILVDSSYLHCCQPETISKMLRSASNPASSAPCSPASPDARDLRGYRIPSATMNLHSKALYELNQTAARYWLGAPHREPPEEPAPEDDPLKFVHPVLSIPLIHPGTTVAPDPKGSEHSFTITVPGGGSFFGRNEKKYVLRSYVEDDMVDWCIALKELVGGGALVKTATPGGRSQQGSVPPPPPHRDASQNPLLSLGSSGVLPFGGSASTTFSFDDAPNGTGVSDRDFSPRERSSAEPQLQLRLQPLTAPPSKTPIQELDNPWDQ